MSKKPSTAEERSAFGGIIAVAVLLTVVVVEFLLQLTGVRFAILFCLVVGATSVWFGVFHSYRSKPSN